MGRTKGAKNKIKIKPPIHIKEVILTTDKPFGVQLKQFRKMKGLTLEEMAATMKWHPSNISHFENGDTMVGNSIRTAVKYGKALNIRQFKIIL